MKLLIVLMAAIAAALLGLYVMIRPVPVGAPDTATPIREDIRAEGEAMTAPTTPTETRSLLAESASLMNPDSAVGFSFTTSIHVEHRGRTSVSGVEGKVMLGNANRGVAHLKTDREEIKVYNNPETRSVYLLHNNQYQHFPPFEERRDFVAAMMPGALEPWCAWLADLLQDATALSNTTVASSTCGTTPCWEVTTDSTLYTLRAFFPDDGHPLPMTATMDLKEPALRRHLKTSNAVVRTVTEFSDWQLDEMWPDSTFAFTPPRDAREKTAAAPSPSSSIEVGQPAPDFSLELLAGGTVHLKDHIGKDVVILDFWASWCGPCRRAMPIVAQIAQAFEDQGVVLYAINVRETPERAQTFLDDHALSIPVLMDKTGSIGALYQVTGIPKLVLVGRDGLIKAVHRGLAPNLEERLAHEIAESL